MKAATVLAKIAQQRHLTVPSSIFVAETKKATLLQIQTNLNACSLFKILVKNSCLLESPQQDKTSNTATQLYCHSSSCISHLTAILTLINRIYPVIINPIQIIALRQHNNNNILKSTHNTLLALELQ